MKPLKRFEKYVSAFFKVGKTERLAKGADRAVLDIYGKLEEVNARLDEQADRERRQLADARNMIATETNALLARNAEIARFHMDLSRRFDQVLLNDREASLKQDHSTLSNGSAHADAGFSSVMDNFYHKLENKYRGTVQDIKKRLQVYLPDVEAAVLRCGGKPVMDIGCGRGEWLTLLDEADITAFGVDTNAMQIAEVKALGLNVRHQDARTALEAAKDGSLSCITAHHLIEHLPFEEVLWITRESLRVLAPGGLLLFETPNVRNILVGATSFHNDPTHLRPMTEPVLEVLFETIGYYPIELRSLHPHERLSEFFSKPDFDHELAHLLFGPQDLAILGLKPLEA